MEKEKASVNTAHHGYGISGSSGHHHYHQTESISSCSYNKLGNNDDAPLIIDARRMRQVKRPNQVVVGVYGQAAAANQSRNQK